MRFITIKFTTEEVQIVESGESPLETKTYEKAFIIHTCKRKFSKLILIEKKHTIYCKISWPSDRTIKKILANMPHDIQENLLKDVTEEQALEALRVKRLLWKLKNKSEKQEEPK